MKTIPPRPGLPSALQGRPEASTPDAGSRRGWREGGTATALHGDTRPRVAHGECPPGRDGVQGWGGRAGGWERGCGRPRQGPRGEGRGRRGAWERAGELVTVWFTPHIRTLRIGSLARNSFTFWHTKCFFLVLVLLALSGATATAVVLVQLDDMPGAAAAAAAKGGAAESAHKPAAPGLPRTDPHPRSLTAPWSRPSRYLPTPPRWFRPPHAPPSPARPQGAGQPARHPAPGRPSLKLPAGWYGPFPGGCGRPARPSSPGLTGTRPAPAPQNPAPERGGERGWEGRGPSSGLQSQGLAISCNLTCQDGGARAGRRGGKARVGRTTRTPGARGGTQRREKEVLQGKPRNAPSPHPSVGLPTPRAQGSVPPTGHAPPPRGQ